MWAGSDQQGVDLVSDTFRQRSLQNRTRCFTTSLPTHWQVSGEVLAVVDSQIIVLMHIKYCHTHRGGTGRDGEGQGQCGGDRGQGQNGQLSTPVRTRVYEQKQ